jgi:hypothetical protein
MPGAKKFCIVVLTQAIFLCIPPFSRADAVTDWNQIAVTTIAGVPSHPGATSFLDSAIVQAAVYDAVESITGRFRPYAVHVPGASGSTDAAVAKAAHDVLVNRFPFLTASLDTTYHNYLAAHNLSESDLGVAVGAAAAAGIITLRASDGSFPSPPPPPFTGGSNVGEWRPTPSFQPGGPPSFSPMLAPWLATVTPFTLTSPSQFRAVPPPSLMSKRYAVAYNEVKAIGARFNSARTTEQTNVALFFFANYLVMWNQALRDIATTHLSSIDDSARLFALVNLAMTDAVITAWDTKRHYVFWRPLTAIRNGDSVGNPEIVGDPNWEPLINNPNYPDYTSGANNVTGAATRSLELFFGNDEMEFTLHTTNATAPVQTRDYHRLSDAAYDVVNARIWEGIHFRFADVQARKQGRHVAQWVFYHFLHSVDADESDDHEDDADDE